MRTTTKTAQDEKFLAEARKFDAEAETFSLQSRAHRLAIAREEKLDEFVAAQNDEFNTLHFYGAVTGDRVYKTMREVERFARLRPKLPIEMRVTSPGGDILAGLALIDHIAAIRRQYGVKVRTVALGMAASMAGILLQSGDTRVMGRESWLLIHKASFMAAGTYDQVDDTMKWIEKVQDRIVDLFVSRAGDRVTREQFIKGWERKDWWLSSKEAKRLGFIDEVR